MTITATDFKARCLSLLDEVEQQGVPITITRRGKPVAVLTPALAPVPKAVWKNPENSWKGRIKILGDIVNADPDIKWDCVSED